MRASDLGRYLVICDENDSRAIRAFLGHKEKARYEHLSIFDAGDRREELDRGVTMRRYAIRRYLDRFYLCFRDGDSGGDILRGFYDLIADEYELLIDRSRNIDNICNLLHFLDRISPINDKTIVDYGCGVGLSLELESEFHIHLVGFDWCTRMREIASSKGMRVFSPEDLLCQPEEAFDGAFASYVLHLFPKESDLTHFWRLLKRGGALVANFHKNQGIGFVNDCLNPLGCSTQVLQTVSGSEKHGAYIAYVKNV